MTKLTPTSITISAAIIATAVFYYFYAQPQAGHVRMQPILGQSTEALSFEDLTIISKMPFLTNENKTINIESLTVDENLFYVPKPVAQVEQSEAAVVEAAEDFAPPEYNPPKPNYVDWARENLRVQSIATNGAIINDRFYKLGKPIITDASFEDGSTFAGSVVEINQRDIKVKINGGATVTLALGR
jgi:hypothetical protein